MKPCKFRYDGCLKRERRCMPRDIERYRDRVSKPLLEHILKVART